MAFNPKKHHRRTIRLKGYDYASEGLYFITIVCQNMKHLFGHIENEKMIFNDAGKHANQCWLDIPDYFPNIKLHAHQIMPNHLHGIIEITHRNSEDVRAKNFSPNSNENKRNAIKPTPNSNENNISAKNFLPPNATSNNISAKNFSPNCNENNNPSKSISPLPEPNGKNNSIMPHSPVKTVGSMVRGFKTGVTMWFRLNHADKYPIGTPIWQRNYHEHIIRDDTAYQNISNYIINNPKKWTEDKFRN